MTEHGFSLSEQLADLAVRNAGRTEADIQSDVKNILLFGGFDLGEDQVRLEAPAADRRRIDVEVGALVIEVKRDLRPHHIVRNAQEQLEDYLEAREAGELGSYVGLLTDGTQWLHFQLTGEGISEVSRLELRPSQIDVRRFRTWLGALLSTEHSVQPTSDSIEERLGAESPSFRGAITQLDGLWAQGRESPEVQVKRGLWAKLLRTALGTQFEDDDDLFLEHTYLVIVATLIAHMVVGYQASALKGDPEQALSGRLFARNGIRGVGESGFFDWILDVPGGRGFVGDVARRLSVFTWAGVDHDVLKALYQSVISEETRHRLGEYYTPDWLAARIVAHVVDDPLNQRVLDPACGSGTFLFHAIRAYLAKASEHGVSQVDAVSGVTANVFGMDLHPVAVTLAQVTYLLAIGAEMVTAVANPGNPLSVPVYLGDSMRWTASSKPTIYEEGEVVVPTGMDGSLFEGELRFPRSVASNPSQFDRLVDELAFRAADRPRGTTPKSIEAILNRYGVAQRDRSVIEATYRRLCELHDQRRDHIWGFFVKNQSRPTWFASAGNRVDVLVGNPPWLSYRHMPAEMQELFQKGCRERRLWVGGKVATHQDLSAYFVARSVEQYLNNGGKFGFVMPLSVLSRKAYAGFQSADFAPPQDSFVVKFGEPWDLDQVRPHPFPVPSCAVFGSRHDGREQALPIPNDHHVAIGRVDEHGGVHGGDSLKWKLVERDLTCEEPQSPYASRFRQGATLVPRMLLLVEEDEREQYQPVTMVKVRSRRGSLDKPPWKNLPDQMGMVESIFHVPVYLGEHCLPFKMIPPSHCVIPHHQDQLMKGSQGEIDRFPGLADWWRSNERVWEENRGEKSNLSLNDRIDYFGNLSAQFPAAPIRAVYTKSGNYLTAAVISDERAVIDHNLYWGSVSSMDEANYLMVLLNSPALLEIVQPYQSRGAFGPRHFDKYVWCPPIPEYKPGDPLHEEIAGLAPAAYQVVAETEIPDTMGFQKARSVIRERLEQEGFFEDVESLLAALLAESL